MFKNIFTKTLYEKKWTIILWSIGLVAMAVLTVSLFPSFNKQGIDEVIGSVPDSLKSLVGSVDSYRTINGYVAQQVFGPQIPIFTIILAIILFYGLSVADEDRGTLQTLLAEPVSRQQVFLQRLYAGVVSIMLICASIGIGVLVGGLLIGENISILRTVQATFMCTLMTLAYGALAYAVGMATGKKGLTIAVASGYAFLSFFISSLAPAIDALKPVDKLSIFYYYNTPQTMVSGIDWLHAAVITLVFVVLSAVSLLFFVHRDIVKD